MACAATQPRLRPQVGNAETSRAKRRGATHQSTLKQRKVEGGREILNEPFASKKLERGKRRFAGALDCGDCVYRVCRTKLRLSDSAALSFGRTQKGRGERATQPPYTKGCCKCANRGL